MSSNSVTGAELCDVAIVGAGAAATSLLAALAARLVRSRQRVSVRVIDTVPLIGTGGVYQDDLRSILLNTQAGEIALMPGQPLHFTRWLAQRKGSSAEAELTTYAPRRVFGHYLNDVFAEIRDADNGMDVIKVEDHVDHVQPEKAIWRLRLRSKRTLTARLVVLAIGPSRPADPYQLAGHNNYVHMPFPAWRSLGGIPARSSVLVLGSQLSAIDVAVALGELGHTGPMIFASRRGVLPLVKAGSSIRPQDADLELFRSYHQRHGRLPLRVLAQSFRQRLGERGLRMREYLRAPSSHDAAATFRHNVELARRNDPTAVIVEPSIVDALAMLSEDDTAIFMRVGYPVLLYKHTAIPLVNAEKILQRLQAGSLTVRGGLREVVANGERFIARFHNGVVEHADVVVNATGAARSTCGAGTRAPFRDLCEAGLVREIATGGARVSPEGKLVSASGGRTGRLYVLGHDSIGTHPFINSLSMISTLAGQMAQSILDEVLVARDTNFRAEAVRR